MYGIEQVDGSAADPHAHEAMVLAIVEFMKPKLYVELGVDRGATFKKILALQEAGGRRAVGCELLNHDEKIKDVAYGVSSVNFAWALPDGSVGVAFIDAHHAANSVMNDIRALDPKMAVNGVILIHDTYPPAASYQDIGRCGDGWTVVAQIRSEPWFSSQFEIMTLPTQFGLTLIRKHRGRHLAWNPNSGI